MKRRTALVALAALPLSARAAPLPEVQVFKSATCGCCGAWVEHLRSAGFTVRVSEVSDTAAARKRLGMPDRFGSCHTAAVGAYVVEGHVPANEVKRLLAQKPKALGLAVPSMPVGSPGMEMGSRQDPYDVYLVGADGTATVFARYPQ